MRLLTGLVLPLQSSYIAVRRANDPTLYCLVVLGGPRSGPSFRYVTVIKSLLVYCRQAAFNPLTPTVAILLRP